MTSFIHQSKENLSDKAYQILKEMIVSGKLAQGDIISISAMAETLNISRTPITNACHRLEANKFLKIVPKQGVIINAITIEDIREIYELRAAIESYSAKRAFENIKAEDIEYLKDSLKTQLAFIENNDVKGFMQEDLQFHMYLLKKYRNTQFFTLLDTLFDKAFMIGLMSVENTARLSATIKEHEEIIEALEKGDKSSFVDTIELNILNGYINLTGKYEMM